MDVARNNPPSVDGSYENFRYGVALREGREERAGRVIVAVGLSIVAGTAVSWRRSNFRHYEHVRKIDSCESQSNETHPEACHRPIIGPLLGPLDAADIRVGTDVKTIHEAIKLAQPGNTIHLQPIVYRDYAGFYGKKGEPGKPITPDGHGATHPYNDGFNIHGDCRNVLFENIRAIECGDDGISSHESAEYRNQFNQQPGPSNIDNQ